MSSTIALSSEIHATARRRFSGTPWLALWAIVAALQIVLLINHARLDTLAWRSTRWFMGDQNAYQFDKYRDEQLAKTVELNGPESLNSLPFYITKEPPLHARIYKRTEGLWRLLRDLGEPLYTLALVVLLCVYWKPWWRAASMLIAAACSSGIISTLIRMILGRYRPIVTDGESTFSLFRGFHEGSNLSWPSGHATLAFATAAAFTYLSPRGRWYFLTVATGCSIARVVMQAHFWSDAILGAALGWTLGWATMVVCDRLLPNRPAFED